MKNIKYFLLMTAALIAGCTDDNEQLALDGDNQVSFTQITASFSDDADTRMYLNDGKHLTWTYHDVLGVYSNEQDIEKYANAQWGDGVTMFRGNEVSGSQFYAFFPYSEDAVVEANDRSKLRLPLVASYGENCTYRVEDAESSSLNFRAPVIAKSSNNEFQFRHLMGYLKIDISDVYAGNTYDDDGNIL